MTLNARFPISSDRLQLSMSTAAGDIVQNGILLDGLGTVARAATSGGTQWQNGLLLTPTSQVVCVDATGGLPAGAQWQNGLALAATGELCVSTNPVATWQNGLPRVANGALAADGLTSPVVAQLKSLAAVAPATVAAIPRAAGVTPTMGASNEVPAYDYVRYWVSGAGKNDGGGGTDNPRLQEVAYCHNFANWGYMYDSLPPDQIIFNFSDGSKPDARAAYTGFGSSRPYIGIKTNSRYLSISGMAGAQFRLTVDGVNWPYTAPLAGNNVYSNWDFGSSANRNIIISGQGDGACFFGDVCLARGATISPYNFIVEGSNLPFAFDGDSYLGYNDDVTSNTSFVEMMARMIGSNMGIAESGRGSTGYQRNAGGTGWAAAEAQRLAFMNAQGAKVISVQLGINDSIPRDASGPAVDTVDAIATTLTSIRSANPGSVLIVQGPWAPNQTNGANPGGKYQIILARLKVVLQGLAGPWIFLDNLNGDWLTSKGTSRGTLRGAWQTGTGNVGAPTGSGNGDTWVQADGTHPTVPVGITGLSQIWAAEVRAALVTL